MVAPLAFGQNLVTTPEQREKLFGEPLAPLPGLPSLEPAAAPVAAAPAAPAAPVPAPVAPLEPALTLGAAQAQPVAASPPTVNIPNDQLTQMFDNLWRTQVQAGQRRATLYDLVVNAYPGEYESGGQIARQFAQLQATTDPTTRSNLLRQMLDTIETVARYSGVDVSSLAPYQALRGQAPAAAAAPAVAPAAPAPAAPAAPAAAGAKPETPGEKAIREASEQARLKFIEGPPIQLTGPFTQTPLGQALTNLFGRGAIPTLDQMRLMAEAELGRLQQEEQRLMNDVAREVQRGNLTIASQNAATQREIAVRVQALSELLEPFRAGTERISAIGEIAQSPLIGYYTARGQAPPSYLQGILSAPISPGSAGADTSFTTTPEPAPFQRSLATGMQLPSFSAPEAGAPQLPSAAQWAAFTPGEREGTIQLFEQSGIPRADFLAMLERSFPPGGGAPSPATFVSPVG